MSQSQLGQENGSLCPSSGQRPNDKLSCVIASKGSKAGYF